MGACKDLGFSAFHLQIIHIRGFFEPLCFLKSRSRAEIRMYARRPSNNEITMDNNINTPCNFVSSILTATPEAVLNLVVLKTQKCCFDQGISSTRRPERITPTASCRRFWSSSSGTGSSLARSSARCPFISAYVR